MQSLRSGFVCLVRAGALLKISNIVNFVNPVRQIMNVSKNSIDINHTFTVFVEGNIGCGKTAFLNHFSKYDALVLDEPVESWRNIRDINFLDLMYKDPIKWGLAFQTIVQKSMLDLHVRETIHKVKMMERSIHSARFCFVENLHRTNKLSLPDYTVLDEWYQWIAKNLDVKGDLIVYLRSDPKVVHKRIKARARPEETHLQLEYLQQLHNLHEDWLFNKTTFPCPCPVVVVDANKDLACMQEEYRKCEQQIISNGYQMRLRSLNSPNKHTMLDTKLNKVIV